MSKTMTLFTVLILFCSCKNISNTHSSKSSGTAIAESQNFTVLKGNIQHYVINSPGAFKIDGKVTGSIDIKLNQPGTVVLSDIPNSSPILHNISVAGNIIRTVRHKDGMTTEKIQVL